MVIYHQGVTSTGTIVMSHRTLIAASACILTILPTAAFAYIDPGTGSLLVQGAIASFVTAGVAIKVNARRVKMLFTKLVRHLRG
jgi:hypothetical protein